jgi:hypothetical protein
MIGAQVITSDLTLEAHVKQFKPDATGEDLTLRVTLLRARDWAASLRGRTESWMATECACHAHEVAGGFVFRRGESVARLRMAADLCRALVRAATAADSLYGEETPL